MDVGSELSGEFIIDTAPRFLWGASDVTDFTLSQNIPALPTEKFDGTNLTTANPLPITAAIATVAASGGSSTTGGGPVDIFGATSGTILIEFTESPLNANEPWLIIDIAEDGTTAIQVCVFYDYAGCIPGATQVLKAEGDLVFVDLTPFSATPVAIDFGEVAIGESTLADVTLTNESNFAAVQSFGLSTVNDCLVNFADLAAFKAGFFPVNNPDADFTGDGLVNFGDLAFIKSSIFNSTSPGPGPSAIPCVPATFRDRRYRRFDNAISRRSFKMCGENGSNPIVAYLQMFRTQDNPGL